MDLDVFVTPGLGDNSFLVVSGDEAALVDPQRDAWRFLAAAESRGARVRAVLETHVHNDYVSGAHEVRAGTGAELVLPARGGYEFAHRPAEEGEEVRVGDLRLVAMATPGHTYEHLAWLVYEDGADEPSAVFTGGSLLVGSAGRTDLVGPGHTDSLSRAQWDSVRRLGALPGTVRVLPTHGAGSFCVSAMPSTTRTSTIAAELQHNTLLTAADEAEFREESSAELMAYPAYYASMGPLNRAGAPVLRALPEPRALTAPAFAERAAAGTRVIDARDRESFAAGHLPGSLNIELNSGFATYIGWLLAFDTPIALVLPEPFDESLTEAMTQLVRIGWTAVDGYLAGGVDAWRADGGETRSYPLGTAEELCETIRAGGEPNVLDVRQPLEWAWSTVPGARQVFVAELAEHLDEFRGPGETWVLCSNGHRAAIAASLLDGAGVPVRLVAAEGVAELSRHCAAAAR